VIGGGKVGTRKALALLDAGAYVKVIAPHLSDELRDAAASGNRLHLEKREYIGADDITEFEVVYAATDSDDLNASIAADAIELHKLVNVASDGSAGNFTSMAIHRAGQLTIGVSAGGVPAAAARIRDEMAERFDGRYAELIDTMSAERDTVIRSRS
jgi:precorrin-2 dehydrogenase/sirohydrochlorin ferrochelatase